MTTQSQESDVKHRYQEQQGKRYAELVLGTLHLQESSLSAERRRLEPQAEEARTTLLGFLQAQQTKHWHAIHDGNLKQAAVDAAGHATSAGYLLKTRADGDGGLVADVRSCAPAQGWQLAVTIDPALGIVAAIEAVDDPMLLLLDSAALADLASHPLVRCAAGIFLPYGLIAPVVNVIVTMGVRPPPGRRTTPALAYAFLAGLRDARGTSAAEKSIYGRELATLVARVAHLEADLARCEAALAAVRADCRRLQAGESDFAFIAAHPDVERIFVDPPIIEVRTRPIVIKDDLVDHYIGPIVMTFDTATKRITYVADSPFVETIKNMQGRIAVEARYATPHCKQGDAPCFGEGMATVANLWLTGRLTDLIIFALQSLQGYNEHSAFRRLEHWPVYDTGTPDIA